MNRLAFIAINRSFIPAGRRGVATAAPVQKLRAVDRIIRGHGFDGTQNIRRKVQPGRIQCIVLSVNRVLARVSCILCFTEREKAGRRRGNSIPIFIDHSSLGQALSFPSADNGLQICREWPRDRTLSPRKSFFILFPPTIYAHSKFPRAEEISETP